MNGERNYRHGMIAHEDTQLLDWLLGIANQKPVESGDFLKSLADAALRADWENYAALRPALLYIRDKYPQYNDPDGACNYRQQPRPQNEKIESIDLVMSADLLPLESPFGHDFVDADDIARGRFDGTVFDGRLYRCGDDGDFASGNHFGGLPHRDDAESTRNARSDAIPWSAQFYWWLYRKHHQIYSLSQRWKASRLRAKLRSIDWLLIACALAFVLWLWLAVKIPPP
jgi:hypothetical protein